jgi:pimeloyl-ACP methyl ester carboxylesterase
MSISKTLSFSASDGVKIAASSYGNKDFPVVIMLHGAGQTRHSWHRSAVKIAENGFNVVTVDTRGHGDSNWSAGRDYALDTLVSDLNCIVQQLGAGLPTVVGASLGGITALLAQGESDTRLFEALALVDITPRVDRKGVARILDFMNRFEDGFSTIAEAADAVADYKGNASSEKNQNPQGLLKNLRLRDNGRYYWHWDPALLDHVSGFDEKVVERQRAAAQSLTLPVLLLHGKLSEIVSDADAEDFLQLVPHARYVDIAQASHMLATDDNDVFANAIVEFLTECN